MIIEKLEDDTVCDNGGLTHRNVGKRSCMDHAGLVFHRTHEGGINGVAHPGGHGPTHFKVTRGYLFSALVKSQSNPIKSLSEIGKISDNGEDGHQFG